MYHLVERDKNITPNFTETQFKIIWPPFEIKVEKDMQDILVNMTESEKHGTLTVLKLFSLYELKAGEEYWATRFKEIFPDQIEYIKMANIFSFAEINMHLPFYNKIDQLLHVNTDDYYNSYVQDKTLKSRIEFIDWAINNDNDLVSLGVFSMVEGGVLYSSFGFLKHFQSKGKNLLMNVVRGINFSVRDENLHSVGGAYAFKDLLSRRKLTDSQKLELYDILYKAADQLKQHEFRIAEMIFEKGPIEGITEKQMQHFIESRINKVLEQLGLNPLYKVTYNPIAEWFYEGINGFVYNDFFSGIGNSYSRSWDESSFIWKAKKTDGIAYAPYIPITKEPSSNE